MAGYFDYGSGATRHESPRSIGERDERLIATGLMLIVAAIAVLALAVTLLG